MYVACLNRITCSLCKHCRAALSKIDGKGTQRPTVHMPSEARANGLWHGPEPEEFQDLSYAECK
eukprot:12421815-Karenia_brevis.AAC.1